ncbi:translation initiation factor IF-2 [Solitalea lacus]|uniref:translation initiation factor IF-2 n=1 Tax=Solitalea lacus TaxID=2911172 RepID=UPI001EDA3A23|nr:translation initiation factor IF-2 [Solitalea lacus]UKJ07545.1 translation initiation factor IF-2 [Solitalea lacus]
MSEDKQYQLFKVAKELNIGLNTAVDHLNKKGYKVDAKPTTKINDEMYAILQKEFQLGKIIKEEAKHIHVGKVRRDEVSIDESLLEKVKVKEEEPEEILIKNVSLNAPVVEKPKVEAQEEPKPEQESAPSAPAITPVSGSEEIPGVKVVGKIDLDALNPKKKIHKEEPAAVEPQVVAEEKMEKPQVVAQEPVKPVEENVKQEAPAAKVEKEEPVASSIAEEEKPVVVKAEIQHEESITPHVEEPSSQETIKEDDVIRARAQRLSGPNIIGKIQLPVERKGQPVASSSDSDRHKRKRKRKDIQPGAGNAPQGGQQGQGGQGQGQGHGGQRQGQGQGGQRPGQGQGHGGQRPGQGQGGQRQGQGQGGQRQGQGGERRFENRPGHQRPDSRGAHARPEKEEVDEKKVQEQIKQTLAKLTGAGKQNKFAAGRKHRRQKRDDYAQSREEQMMQDELESKILKVTEFVTANELANMMDVPVTKVIATCMSLGMFVSINQRLDAETLTIVADEFGYSVEFVSADVQEEIEEDVDDPADLVGRSPIVTVMGHVDHGKTSLLDFIRKANVIAGEAGGITQHIGAYEVKLESGKKITFLDTPGHEAFTAMRARGANVTDIAIIVIAADDAVMPQTREAINHAMAANVPIVFAFNKIDREGANPDRIREQLSAMNILVEEWGGKYQTQEISAKKGLNIDLLLEKVLLEAEMLDLKANPNRRAVGTVIEAALDKGRGIVTTVLIQTGTLNVGDPILAGSHSGRVKAMFNETGAKISKAGPSTPVLVLGMQGAPQAGDKFIEAKTEQEAKEIANKRTQLMREQGLRTQKHITLDEIGRRLAIGNFKELNIIVKGDVDGSVEALSDSLLKLSTEEIQVNIIHKSVGQISDSDVLLASASDAIIIGFQVRPSASARKLAEQEQIDIRMYSVIYKAIEEIKAAMEGMLSPEIEEKIVANVEIRETFKISKVGTIAGCMVLDGKIHRNNKIRIVRDGVVVHNGELDSLKRFKDDVKEVATGYECGLNIKGFNDIKVGDIVEAYEEVEVKRKL